MPKEYITYIQDSNTGECKKAAGGYYVSPEQAEEYRRRRAEGREAALRRLRNDERTQKYGNFVFFRYDFSTDVFATISAAFITKLFYLSTFLQYNSNILMNNNGKHLAANKLTDILNVSESTCRRFVEKMVQQSFLTINQGEIEINKSVFAKRKIHIWRNSTKQFTRIYISSFRYLFDHLSLRQQAQLGYLIKLIPYLHQNTNAICINPEESNPDLLKTMDMKTICSIVGYSPNQAARLRNALTDITLENGKPVFIYNSDQQAGYINPLLFYAGNQWDVVLREFSRH